MTATDHQIPDRGNWKHTAWGWQYQNTNLLVSYDHDAGSYYVDYGRLFCHIDALGDDDAMRWAEAHLSELSEEKAELDANVANWVTKQGARS